MKPPINGGFSKSDAFEQFLSVEFTKGTFESAHPQWGHDLIIGCRFSARYETF